MEKKSSNFKGAVGTLFVRVIISVAVVGVIAAVSTFLSKHSKTFSGGTFEDLNPLVEAGEELPVGTYGQLSIRWIVGEFATETSSIGYGGSSGFKTGTTYYYMAILDDMSIIAVKANDEGEINRLNALTTQMNTASNVYGITPQSFEGRITKLSGRDLKTYYDEAAAQVTSGASDRFQVKYLILDTTSSPLGDRLSAVIFGAIIIAGVTIAVVAIVKNKKRKKAQMEREQAEIAGND